MLTFLLLFFAFGYTVLSQTEEEGLTGKRIDASLMDSVAMLKITDRLDSLNPNLSKVNNKLDSIKNGINYRIDSLNRLKLPAERYTRLLDSLNQLGPAKTLNEAEKRLREADNKINLLEEKVNSPTSKVEGAINDKLDLMKRKGGEAANLPGNLDLPGAEAPSLDVMPEGELGVKGENRLPGVTGKGSIPGINDIPGLDELNQAQRGLGEVNRITGEVSAYSEDVKNIASGNLNEIEKLPETVEAQAVKVVDAGELQTQSQVVDEYKDVLASGNNPEALKQEAVKQVPKMATNHFKGNEEVLQQAIDKVNSYKTKYTELTDLENIPRRQPNQMKGKPFVERLVPALTLQIQNSNDFLLDYNVAVGYRVSKRFTAGLGWNERVGITNKFGFTLNDRIFGPRSFLEFKLKKGFALRTDIEKMNVFIPQVASGSSDLGSRQWVWSAFVGMKKDYDFVKSIKGNFQFLYNLYDDHHNSPYASRLVVRFGFEFGMKKKEKDQ